MLWLMVCPVVLGAVVAFSAKRANVEGASLYLVAGIIAALAVPMITHLRVEDTMLPLTAVESDYMDEK